MKYLSKEGVGYLVHKIISLLERKADLVGGKVPESQLPTIQLDLSVITDQLEIMQVSMSRMEQRTEQTAEAAETACNATRVLTMALLQKQEE